MKCLGECLASVSDLCQGRYSAQRVTAQKPNRLHNLSHLRLLICDLEGRWGNRLAPEISCGSDLNAGWTEKSNIYDLGLVIRGIVYANNPITSHVERPLPSPIEEIAEGCTRNLPQDRLSLEDLHDLVDAF